MTEYTSNVSTAIMVSHYTKAYGEKIHLLGILIVCHQDDRSRKNNINIQEQF